MITKLSDAYFWWIQEILLICNYMQKDQPPIEKLFLFTVPI
ncbi:hypothetical protein [Cytobacillus praedii]|nr:hypothetical protein [Cytobacillus praedii]